MVKCVIALIRHGAYEQPSDVPSAHLPYPLTTEGEMQARGLAPLVRAFAEENGLTISNTIDSSNLLRGWQTATSLKNAMGEAYTVASFDDLAERSLGSAANLTVEKIEAIMERDPRFSPPPVNWKSKSEYQLPLQGAESLMNAGIRVARHIAARVSEITETAQSDFLKIFVGHGAAFRHAAVDMGALGLSDIPKLSMFHCSPVYLTRQPSGSWAHYAGDWKIRKPQEDNHD